MPLDTNKNDSWNSSSSESDINNATTLSKSSKHIASNLFISDDTSDLTYKNKVIRKRRKLQRCKPEVTVLKGTLAKKTKVMSIKDGIPPKTKTQVIYVRFIIRINDTRCVFINNT